MSLSVNRGVIISEYNNSMLRNQITNLHSLFVKGVLLFLNIYNLFFVIASSYKINLVFQSIVILVVKIASNLLKAKTTINILGHFLLGMTYKNTLITRIFKLSKPVNHKRTYTIFTFLKSLISLRNTLGAFLYFTSGVPFIYNVVLANSYKFIT